MKKTTPNPNNSNADRYSLAIGIIAAAASISSERLLAYTSGNLMPMYLAYGGLVVITLASLCFFSLPVFRKNNYPGVLGLFGMILCTIVLFNSANTLVAMAGLLGW